MSVDWDLILEKLDARDKVEKQDFVYFKAFKQLSQLGLQTCETENTNFIEKSIHVEKVNQLQLHIDNLQDKLSALTTENNKLRKQTGHLNEKVNNLSLEINEKNKAIETINDELLSCNIQMNVLTSTVNTVTQENEELVRRWMEKVGMDAEEMNRANEMNNQA